MVYVYDWLNIGVLTMLTNESMCARIFDWELFVCNIRVCVCNLNLNINFHWLFTRWGVSQEKIFLLHVCTNCEPWVCEFSKNVSWGDDYPDKNLRKFTFTPKGLNHVHTRKFLLIFCLGIVHLNLWLENKSPCMGRKKAKFA
jgi:hypothetical protein